VLNWPSPIVSRCVAMPIVVTGNGKPLQCASGSTHSGFLVPYVRLLTADSPSKLLNGRKRPHVSHLPPLVIFVLLYRPPS
jgi:hypothetical protein